MLNTPECSEEPLPLPLSLSLPLPLPLRGSQSGEEVGGRQVNMQLLVPAGTCCRGAVRNEQVLPGRGSH